MSSNRNGTKNSRWSSLVIENRCLPTVFHHLEAPGRRCNQHLEAYFINLFRFIKGAPEGVLSRCTHVRVDGQKVPLTPSMTQKIVDQCVQYGTGRDTLRCLALGTIDSPPSPKNMNLEDSTKFIGYEQDITFVGWYFFHSNALKSI